MRILITADLHYNITRSRRPAEQLARRICDTRADALVLLGDTAGREPGPFLEALGLFERFAGLKLLVPGNHCLWCRPGENSLQRYHQNLVDWAGRKGFAVLDHAPQMIDGVGLVGSIGWYDYSYRDESLAIPLAFYEHKLTPGAAAWMGQTELVESHSDQLEDHHMEMGMRWRDGQFVKLPFSDQEFTEQLARRLENQLRWLARQVDRIVVFTHHLPFAQLVPPDRPPRFAFAAAFLGSDRIGQAIRTCSKVTDVYCGHSHWPMEIELPGSLRAVNVGSTYTEKRLEVFDTAEAE
jgi:Icc-related predicted phosphoesterase